MNCILGLLFVNMVGQGPMSPTALGTLILILSVYSVVDICMYTTRCL